MEGQQARVRSEHHQYLSTYRSVIVLSNMPRLAKATIIAAAIAALAACTTTGIIGADIVSNGRAVQPVLISWKSTDGSIDGSMTATLPDSTYQGRFLQITRQSDANAMDPMWAGWQVGWPDWGFGGMPTGYDFMQFTTIYSGKVIANLRNAGGDLMRCRFQVAQPDRGMAGGGTGECQLADGRTMQANF
jgi:hypothetical protein